MLSSFVEPEDRTARTSGTIVCDEEEIVEKRIVSGVAYTKDEAKITASALPDHPGVAAAIFGPLADANINVDMIVQNLSRRRRHHQHGLHRRQARLPSAPSRSCEQGRGRDRLRGRRGDEDVAKVSVIGVGMRSHAGVAAKTMFEALAEKGVNIQAISTSEIKICVLIDAAYTELAVRALHSLYGLDK